MRVHLEAVKDRRLGPYHFATYAALIVHGEIDTGDARPSVETIAGYFAGSGEKGSPRGMGDRTVRTCIRDLERWGYISVELQEGAASRYRLLRPPTLARGAGVGTPTLARGAGESGTPLHATLAPGADEQEVLNKNQEQETVARAFEELWERYPARSGRKLAKGKALEQWKRLKDPERQQALEAVKQYRKACDAGDTLAKDAFRWLRDKAFEDWAQPVQQTPGRYGTAPTSTRLRCDHGEPIAEGDDGWFSRCEVCTYADLERAARGKATA